jgi:hypothetical protein
MTAMAVITAALRELRVLGEGQSISPENAAIALERLNTVIDGFAIEGLTIPYLQRTIVPLVAGQASYTIGTGGHIPMVAPVEITYARLRRPV